MSVLSLDYCLPFAFGLDHPEGVAWGLDGFVYAGGEAGQFYRVGLDGQVMQIATTDGFILGLALDADSAIYACVVGKPAVVRVAPNGTVTPYSLGTPQRPMVNPNYPVFDRAGNLYVSDSGQWKKNNGAVFRVRPDGVTELWNTVVTNFPNGMALAPKEDALYIACSTPKPSVVRLPITADGSAGTPETVIELPETVPDGLAFDSVGDLYIACYAPNRIYRFSSTSRLDVLIEDWENTIIAGPANIAFCGADHTTMVISSLSRWHLTRVELGVRGLPLHYPHLGHNFSSR